MRHVKFAVPLALALTLPPAFSTSLFTILHSQGEIVTDLRWSRTAGFPLGGLFWAIAIDPTDPGALYAGVENLGFITSRDGGATWRRSDPGHHFVRALAIDPLDSTTAYYLYGGGLVVIDPQTGRFVRTAGMGVAPGYALENGAAAIAVDRLGRTVYLGSNAGVFRTSDKGRTVERIGSGLPSATTYSALTIDPFDPDTIYAGTRGPWKYDYLYVGGTPQGYVGKGIYKSTDGGNTWESRNTGLANLNVNTILVHPDDRSRLYAATWGGVFRSTNAGVSWTAINTGLAHTEVWTLVMDPRDPDRLYAGTWGGGLYTSRNGGASWERTRFSGIDIDRDHVFSLLPDPHEPYRLYIGTGDGLFTYDTQADTFAGVGGTVVNSGTSFIALHPTDPSTLYALDGGVGGGRDLYRSFDGGASWEFIGPHRGLESTRLGNYHVDHTYGMEIAVHPRNPDIVFYSSAFGLYKSLDRGSTWRRVSLASLTIQHHVHGLAISPKDPNIMYAGTGGILQANVIFLHMLKSQDAGETWRLIDSGLPANENAHVFDVLVHPDNPDVAYMATTKTGFGCFQGHPQNPPCAPFGVYKTIDGGRQWFAVNTGLEELDVLMLAFHPQNPSILYAAAGNGIYVSRNDGPWTKLASFGTSRATAVAPHPTVPNVIFAAALGSGVYVSTNSGETWTPVNIGLDSRNVEHLVIDPQGRTVYAAAGTVYKATLVPGN